MVPDVDLMRMLRYEAWANQEVAASLEQAGIAAPLRALSIMAHIIGASRLWLARAHEQPSDLAVWPSLEISGMRRELDRLESDWTSYLATLTPAQLETRVGYINSQGERWHSSLRDIMTHLSLHSAYHRGQIALLLGQAEHRPAYTDFIHATRQDLV